MRLALNGSTLGACSFAEELAAAASAGFQLVELRAPKLAGIDDPGSLLRANGLSAWSINSLDGTGDGDLAEEARRQAAWAASCDCPYVSCVPGRRRDGLEDAVARLAEICSQEGAALAFEFMGFGWSAVRRLQDALDIHPGQVVIDTFHWLLGDGSLESLRACPPNRIAVVHVSDANSHHLSSLGDADRVLPGDGVLDLTAFYSTLRAIGYDGVYSLELFPDPLPAEGALLAARGAHAAMVRLFL